MGFGLGRFQGLDGLLRAMLELARSAQGRYAAEAALKVLLVEARLGPEIRKLRQVYQAGLHT